MRTFSLVVSAMVLAVPGVAQAAEPPCLTTGEFASLAGYALPSVITGTTQRCSASLGPDAFLPRSGGQLAERYAERKADNWPAARSAFLKLSGGNGDASKLLRDLPDASLQGMLDSVLQGMVSQQIPVERCGTIDKVVRLLAPLPPANMAELVSVMVGLGAKSDAEGKPRKIGKLALCQA